MKMKRIVLLVVMALLVAGTALAKEFEVTKKAGEFDVEARIDRNPPVVGDNRITVTVKDSTGKAVTDAKVKVYYSMPAMPGMPPMNYKTGASPKGEAYEATMNLSMAGPWNIAVRITRGGKTSTMKFNIDAH